MPSWVGSRMIIKAENLTKKFKSGNSELVVLKDLNLSVREGEFLSITGRSGSGKSTLLHQLGLLDKPNSGRIEINGIDVSSLNNDERTSFRLNELGFIFQDYALVPELTALENVLIPLFMQGLKNHNAEKAAREALKKVDLGDRLDNLPSQLSGGEQQRVSIARAIGHKPKIVFADEPTANLDSETAQVVLKTFIDLNKEGQTIVMVTHEPEYANLTHRILVLANGVIYKEKMGNGK